MEKIPSNKFIYYSITGRVYIIYDGPTQETDYDYIVLKATGTYVEVKGDMADYLKSRNWICRDNIMPINAYEIADIERIIIYKLYVPKKKLGSCMPSTENYLY